MGHDGVDHPAGIRAVADIIAEKDMARGAARLRVSEAGRERLAIGMDIRQHSREHWCQIYANSAPGSCAGSMRCVSGARCPAGRKKVRPAQGGADGEAFDVEMTARTRSGGSA